MADEMELTVIETPDDGEPIKPKGDLFGFIDSRVADDNYIGDIQFMDALCRSLVLGSIERHIDVDRVDRAVRGDVADCKRAARILLGKDDRFTGPAWYAPGGIDRHLAKWCGIASEKPVEMVSGALINMLTEIHDLGNYAAEDGVLEEQWDFQVNEIVNRYSGLMVGMTLGQIASIGDTEE